MTWGGVGELSSGIRLKSDQPLREYPKNKRPPTYDNTLKKWTPTRPPSTRRQTS